MDRRRLLKLTAAGMLLPAGVLEQSAIAAAAKKNGRRLILVQLAGANDGLNTLVPFTNDHYYELRPVIGLSRDQLIPLSDELALHDALKPLMPLWEQGELAWVQGLGYPQPNRSHFKSIALWESGGDGQRDGRQGWITHDIEHRYSRQIYDPHGISLVGDMGLFASDTGRWMSMSSASQFAKVDAPLAKNIPGAPVHIKLVIKRMQELHHSLASMSSKLDNTPEVKKIRGGKLGEQLQQVVKLIRAGVDTPVYRVKLDGFDTHENQLGRHANLLRQLAIGLTGLKRVLVEDNEWTNTVIMTYSEFGRRAAENMNKGTDHGTAAPHLITGGAITGGLYGRQPDLAVLSDGDPAFTLDYRALYDRVLLEWFAIDDNQFNKHRQSELSGLLSQSQRG